MLLARRPTESERALMIEQQGMVVAVSGDLASVQLGGSSGCPACDAGRGCGAGVFGRLLQRKPVVLELNNQPGAQPGQAVLVGLPEALFLSLVFGFYLFPLLAALAGAAIGHYVSVRLQVGTTAQDGIALFAGVLAGAFVLRWKNQGRRSRSEKFPGKIAIQLLGIVEPDAADRCETE
jgi:sigma-E factor negative regulatory protein RseC